MYAKVNTPNNTASCLHFNKLEYQVVVPISEYYVKNIKQINK